MAGIGRLTWTKPKGSVSMSVRSCELRRSGEVLAKAQAQANGTWFWYAMGAGIPKANTAHAPAPDLDAAKAQAEAHVRKALAARALLAEA